MTAETPPLLQDFEVPDAAAWRERVTAELRGKSAEDFSWTSEDGIATPAFLSARECDPLPHMAPAFDALLRPAGPWSVGQILHAAAPARCAAIAGQAATAGVSHLLLRLDRLGRWGLDPAHLAWQDEDDELAELHGFDQGLGGCSLYEPQDLEQILAGIDLEQQRLCLRGGAHSMVLLAQVLGDRSRAAHRRVDGGIDPMDELLRGRVPGTDLEQLYDQTGEALQYCRDLPLCRPLALHSSGLQRAGATAGQELGGLLAALASLLRAMQKRGHSAAEVLQNCVLRLPVGCDLFQEIAKLRALRLGVARLAQAFGSEILRLPIHVESSHRAQAELDVHSNLLRSTLHGVVGCLGGADAVFVETYRGDQDQGALQTAALARNQLFLLRDEGYLGSVLDPVRGSYCVEFLTDALARKAWQELQQIEAEGGLAEALAQGGVQERIAAAAQARQTELQTRAASLVGSTRFVVPHEITTAPQAGGYPGQLPGDDLQFTTGELLSQLQAASAAGHAYSCITRGLRGAHHFALARPFPPFSTEMTAFEQLQQMVQAAGYRAQILLGDDSRLSRSRADFARDYLQAGGFAVAADRLLTEAGPCDVEVVVLCCPDDQQVTGLAALPRGPLKVVAARPRAELEAGSEGCIWAGSNAYLQLRALFLELDDRHVAAEEEGA